MIKPEFSSSFSESPADKVSEGTSSAREVCTELTGQVNATEVEVRRILLEWSTQCPVAFWRESARDAYLQLTGESPPRGIIKWPASGTA